jgi:hypothetical protein
MVLILCSALQKRPTILVVSSAAAAGHCVHVVPANLSLFLLPMAPEKRKWELMRPAGVMLQVDRWRFNGTKPELLARLMMLQPFANSCGPFRMDLFCATISRAIAA